jgi:hypothetical protein
MQLNPQHPNIQDFPAFLRAMAEALEQMHAEQRAHGAIVGGALNDWLTPTGDSLDAERFKAAAKPVEELHADSMVEDVHSFVAFSIGVIRGMTAAPDEPFRASDFQGKGWPQFFLQLLETISKQGTSTCVKMDGLSEKLKEHSAATPSLATPPPSNPPPAKPAAQQPVFRLALRNATVGKVYQVEPGAIATAIAKQRGDSPEQARISHLQLPEGCGLAFDEATGAVEGTPTSAFEGELSLDYVPSRSERSMAFKVTLLINPDPASLWKDLPPPADAPYQKPLLDHSEVQLGPFRLVAASRRGRSHANKSEFRDDDYALGHAPETGWLVVVVADGAGSAKFSRRGSQIACDVAKNRLVGVLNSVEHNQAEALYSQHRDWQHPEVKAALCKILHEAALAAHYQLKEEVAKPAESLPEPPVLRNYDTTLILFAMKKVGEGCVVASFAIGDGGAGMMPHAGEGFPITKPEGGDYAGQTCFLTMPETLKNDEESLARRFQLTETAEFCAALVMTDGITDPKFPSDAAFADPAQWAAFWAELQPVLTSSQNLLDWMNFFSPGNHDDRTLVAVLLAQSAAPATP